MARNEPLHHQLYAVMAERIRTGTWKQGDRVPSENSLVKEFGTSRGPVRQALARLRTEGLIVGGQGAPPTVQPAVPSQSFDTYVSFTDWAEQLGKEPGQKTIEIARRLADSTAADLLHVREGDPIVTVDRLRMFDGDPVMIEHSMYTEPCGKHLLAVDLDHNSAYQVLKENGIQASRAHNVIDAMSADEFDAHWLGVRTGSALLRLRRTTSDQHGVVMDYTDNRYLPGRATFAIDNVRRQQSQAARISIRTAPKPRGSADNTD